MCTFHGRVPWSCRNSVLGTTDLLTEETWIVGLQQQELRIHDAEYGRRLWGPVATTRVVPVACLECTVDNAQFKAAEFSQSLQTSPRVYLQALQRRPSLKFPCRTTIPSFVLWILKCHGCTHQCAHCHCVANMPVLIEVPNVSEASSCFLYSTSFSFHLPQEEKKKTKRLETRSRADKSA